MLFLLRLSSQAAIGLSIFLILTIAPPSARADEFDLLYMEFDARAMTEAEKRYLQTGLAFAGDYRGLIDGAWGAGSQSALQSYVSREFPDSDPREPRFFHAYFVILELRERMEELGWDDMRFPKVGLSIAAPWGILSPVEGEDAKWRTSNDDLDLNIDISSGREVLGTHNALEKLQTSRYAPYVVRRSDRMVTSVQFANGGGAYLRSDLVAGQWVSVLVTADRSKHDMLGVIASGIHFGSRRNWKLHGGSFLTEVVSLGDRFVAALNEKEEPSARQPAVAVKQPPAGSGTPEATDGPSGSGTAFFVNNTDLVTAEHVVSGCNHISLEDGTPLTVIGTDSTVDLAVLESPKRSRDYLPVSNTGRAKLGERAYVLGYPYYRLIGTALNFTTGNVSALSGISDDERVISISAPVQPGNSGGPLLNGRGEILGVISARLSESAIAEATGSLPQNINYAVTGAELIEFLNRAGVLFPIGQSMAFDMEQGAPENIQHAVVPVLCW